VRGIFFNSIIFLPFRGSGSGWSTGKTIPENAGVAPPFGGFLLTFFGWVLSQFQAELVVSAEVSSPSTGHLVDQAQRERSPVRVSSWPFRGG
jgi:hypothetical protein